jgi:diadenosine tetraphosphate (Ap4A) HIT family hydrolase
MDKQHWASLLRGIDCPLDTPRAISNDYWDFVGALTVSSLYLAKNQTYRGQCLLIFDQHHAARPDQLSARDWGAFCADLYMAQGAIKRTVRPDHINVEALGNMIPHLHWHIVPRYWDDPRWGAPIWLTLMAEMAETRLPKQERRALISELQTAVAVGQATGTEQNTAAG